MYKCTGCEDWFHEKCLNRKSDTAFPSSSGFQDLFCLDCVTKHAWLRSFTSTYSASNSNNHHDSPAINTDAMIPTTMTVSSRKRKRDDVECDISTPDATLAAAAAATTTAAAAACATTASDSADGSASSSTSLDSTDDPNQAIKRQRTTEHQDTSIPTATSTDHHAPTNAASNGLSVAELDSTKICFSSNALATCGKCTDNIYLVKGWRASICTCFQCHKLLTQAKFEFLLVDDDDDDDDASLHSLDDDHEAAQSVSLDRSFQQAFTSTMTPMQQRTLMAGYQYMMDRVRERLSHIAANGGVVTRQHIDEIFRELQDERAQANA
jgi:hypothetical protein